MAIAPKMQDALNEHLNQEFFASYLYLSMAAFCDTINLPGFANWMRVQSKEEYEHAIEAVQLTSWTGTAGLPCRQSASRRWSLTRPWG